MLIKELMEVNHSNNIILCKVWTKSHLMFKTNIPSGA